MTLAHSANLTNSGHSAPSALSHDQFLYACRQALTARTTKTGFDSHLRHEPFLFGTFKTTLPISVASFRKNLIDIVAHAYAASPQFRRQEEINLETISFFSLAIATLVADLETLLSNYAGIPLPRIIGIPVAKKEGDKLPALGQLIAAYESHLQAKQEAERDGLELPEFAPYPFIAAEKGDDAATERDRALVSQEFWGSVLYLVRKTFLTHHRAIVDFLNWQFQPDLPVAKIDWRVRPPVGEAFQQFLRSLQNGGRAGAQFGAGGRGDRGFRGDRGDRGDRGERGERGDRGPRNFGADRPERLERSDRPDKPQRHEKEDRPERAPREEQAQQETRAPREARPPREDRAPRPRNGERSEGGDSATSPAALEEALAEVERSIRILQKNSKRPGLRLKPQNSFVRRQQHMIAEELGYATESVGEGKERAVLLKNKGS